MRHRFKTARSNPTRAVVAHDALGFDAQRSEVSQSALEEKDRAPLSFVGEDLSKSQPGSIIDADMDLFPTGAAALIAPIMGDAVTGTDGLAQLFDVEMEQFPRVLALVTHDRRSRLQSTELGQTIAAQEPRDSGPGKSAPVRDLKSREAQPVQSQDDRDLRGRRLPRAAQWTRGAILQAGHPSVRKRVSHLRTLRSERPTGRAAALTVSSRASRARIIRSRLRTVSRAL